MLRDRIWVGAAGGLVAAAATAGVLLGFGRARLAPAQPFNAIAHLFLGAPAFLIRSADLVATPVGVAVHVVSVLLWGILFGLLAARLRGAALLLAALVYAGLVAAVDFLLLPARLRPGFEQVLSVPEVCVVYLVLALSLAAAIWLIPAGGERYAAR